MRHLGLEVHRLEKLMARQRGYSAAHQDADRQTGMHGYLLRYLYENQERDVFQRDIEKAFSISRSSVTVTLQLMEKNGLIRRESVVQDARLKRIVLTQKAKDLHQQILPAGSQRRSRKSFSVWQRKCRKICGKTL